MRLMLLISLCLPVVALGEPLQKLRSFPFQPANIPADVIRQYEYDPEIGDVGTRTGKLIGFSNEGGQRPAWGGERVENGFVMRDATIFHGFSTIKWNRFPDAIKNCGVKDQTSYTSRIRFSRNGPWPSSVLKIYFEETLASYPLACVGTWGRSDPTGRPNLIVTRNVMQCNRLRVYTDSSLLPGNLHEYQCETATLGVYENAKPEQSHSFKTVYSQYLDTLISRQYTYTPGMQPSDIPRYRQTLQFRNEQGKPQTAVIETQ